ncbi:MAG TPA: DUF4215 domain-containing protein, partial [Candidatus Woesearchaeota archaeon]|nr:DUF4215 domain-containing protein [Candidatus Woesearchaeota archaeon]
MDFPFEGAKITETLFLVAEVAFVVFACIFCTNAYLVVIIYCRNNIKGGTLKQNKKLYSLFLVGALLLSVLGSFAFAEEAEPEEIEILIELPSAVCGDGVIEGDEQCDDGNTLDGDGCSSTCEVESGWLCSPSFLPSIILDEPAGPSECSPVCGDGFIIGDEECDDGNTLYGDGCSSTCEVEAGWECEDEPSVCELIQGTVYVDLINPTERFFLDMEDTFNFEVNVRCEGGYCGDVSLALDPVDGLRILTYFDGEESQYSGSISQYLVSKGHHVLRFDDSSCWEGSHPDSECIGLFGADLNLADYMDYDVLIRIHTCGSGAVLGLQEWYAAGKGTVEMLGGSMYNDAGDSYIRELLGVNNDGGYYCGWSPSSLYWADTSHPIANEPNFGWDITGIRQGQYQYCVDVINGEDLILSPSGTVAQTVENIEGAGRIVVMGTNYHDSDRTDPETRQMTENMAMWAAKGSSKGIIPTCDEWEDLADDEKTPFCTNDINPIEPDDYVCVSGLGPEDECLNSCLAGMQDGDECAVSWEVVPKGKKNSEWTFFVFYDWESNPGEEELESDSVRVRIVSMCGGETGKECECGDSLVGDITLEDDLFCDGDGLFVISDDVNLDCD